MTERWLACECGNYMPASFWERDANHQPYCNGVAFTATPPTEEEQSWG